MRADARLIVTRRSFLQAIGLAFASRFRPIAARFTSLEETDLAWLARWFASGGSLRFAGAG